MKGNGVKADKFYHNKLVVGVFTVSLFMYLAPSCGCTCVQCVGSVCHHGNLEKTVNVCFKWKLNSFKSQKVSEAAVPQVSTRGPSSSQKDFKPPVELTDAFCEL